MADTSADPRRQAETLIAELQNKAAQSAAEIHDRAVQESTTIVASAREKASRQLRRTRDDLAQVRARKLAEVAAAVDAATRQRAAAHRQQQLGAAWPLLRSALLRRWAEAPSRQGWIAATLQLARERLRPAPWTVRLPADASKPVEDDVRQALAARPIEGATLVRDAGIDAGLAIDCAGATLDASLSALLADRAGVEALLCAELERAAPR